MNRRQLLQWTGLAACSMAVPHVRAQTAPIRLLVGYPAGSTVDLSARLLAEHMREPLGRTIVVDNRVGAASRMALEALRAAKPDGQTLAISAHGPMTLFPHLYADLRYDPAKDFTPIGAVNTTDYAISAGPVAGVASFEQLRTWAAANPRRASYGTPGAGSVPHFIGVALAEKAKLPWVHVAYKGSPPAVTDVIGGQLACAVTPLLDVLEKHDAGQLRVLATTGAAPSPLLKGVPSLRELGIDLQVTGWTGLYGPAGMNPAQVETLNRAVQAALATEALKQKFAGLGLVASGGGPQALHQLQGDERRMWGPIVQAAGFTPSK